MTDTPFDIKLTPAFDFKTPSPNLPDFLNDTDEFESEISPEERAARKKDADKLTKLINTEHGTDIYVVVVNLSHLLSLTPNTFHKATNSLEKIIHAVNRIYDPNQKTITPSEAASINALFPQINRNAKLDMDMLDEEEEALLDIQKNSTFFSRCFMKKSPLLTDLMLRFWAKYDGDFIDFLKKDDAYLNQTIPTAIKKEVSCKGLDHIINNPFFASRTMEIIPLEQWNNHITISLFICALDQNTSSHFLDTFIKKIESDPNRKNLKYRSQAILGFLKDAYTETDPIISKQETINSFIRLMNLAKSTELRAELSKFLKVMPQDFLSDITQHLKSDTDYKSFVSLYAQNTSGPEVLLSFKKEDGQNVIWDLYDKSLLPPELMSKFIQAATRTNKIDFLMLPKRSHLEPSFPGYSDLCHFFTDMPHQALHFIASFHQNDVDEEKRSTLITDFIHSPTLKKPLFCRYHMLHHWIKNKQYNKASDFFFGTTTDPIQSVEPTMSQAELDLFWARKDTAGKTPWHYLCECKEKCFFKRNFKPLHTSFLKVCQIPDSSGRTPLDYASDNLKFMQYLADKIPAVAKLMSDSHYSLNYQPVAKPALTEEAPKIVPIQQKQKTEPATEQWTIIYYGSDAELKNPLYRKLIEDEVVSLPPPKSAAMRERINREKKIDTYNASALKTHWNGVKWRLPYVVYDTTIYILPGAARKEAYKQPQALLIRGLVAKLKKEVNSPTLIGHHPDPKPSPDPQNQKK